MNGVGLIIAAIVCFPLHPVQMLFKFPHQCILIDHTDGGILEDDEKHEAKCIPQGGTLEDRMENDGD